MNMFMQDHLGGYVVGGDDATFYPDMWQWLVQQHGVRSVIDVGCGEGHALGVFRDHGCRVRGLDGVPQADEDIIVHDYTLGPFYTTPVDLVWSCEFVEHVEEQFVQNFLETFKCARMVLMTHADVGQGGYHHVNCQPASYWVRQMMDNGFVLDTVLTRDARGMAAMNPSPWNHFARSGLAFRQQPREVR